MAARAWRWSKRNRSLATAIGIIGLVLTVGLTITSILLYQLNNRQQAIVKSHIESLATAEPNALPGLIETLSELGPTVVPDLNEKQSRLPATSPAQNRIKLAILKLTAGDAPQKRRWLKDLLPGLLAASPDEIVANVKIIGQDLQLVADDAGRVSDETVVTVVGGWRTQTTWELLDRVCDGDAAAGYPI